MSRVKFSFILAGLCLAWSAASHASNGSKARADLLPEPEVYNELEASEDGTAYVIVMLEQPVVSADAPRQKRRQAVKQVQDRVLGNLAPEEFQLAYKYKTFSAMTGWVNAEGLATLVADPDVTAVGPSGVVRAQLNESVPFINADDVHGLGYTGAGITVAVLDSGIDSDHPDLLDNIAPGAYHFLGKGTDVDIGAEDDNGHGTHMSGIITSPAGVAPDADILAIKVLDENAEGYPEDWAAGVDHVVANKDNYDNLCVINLSLGGGQYSTCPCDNATALTQLGAAALDAAWNEGIVIFASSGNEGWSGWMTSPACLSAAAAVAAVYDQDLGRQPPSPYVWLPAGCYDSATAGDKIMCSSNRNGCNALAAPGCYIESSDIGGGTTEKFGTSPAAAHCAGVAALMYEKAASLEIGLYPGKVVQIMKNTGAATNDPYGTSPNPKRVDALAAVNAVPPYADEVVCEPQTDPNPTHPGTYWYDVTPDIGGRCDFHVRVHDSDSTNYTNVSLPAGTWQFAVHMVDNEWWASWWDSECENAIFDKFRFQFDNPESSTWDGWTTSVGASSDPYATCACDGWIVDSSTAHQAEQDGHGYRVHVPLSTSGRCWDDISECAGQSSGDATCDGSVNLTDLFALKFYFGQCAPWMPPACCADFTRDGCINLADLYALKAGFGTSGHSPSTGNQDCPP